MHWITHLFLNFLQKKVKRYIYEIFSENSCYNEKRCFNAMTYILYNINLTLSIDTKNFQTFWVSKKVA